MGNNKVLHAVAVAVATAVITPFALVESMIMPTPHFSGAYTHTPVWFIYLTLGAGLFAIDFYVNLSVSQRVVPLWHVLTGWPSVLASSCFTGILITKSMGANLLDFLIAVVMLYGIHELLNTEGADQRFESEEDGRSFNDLPTHGDRAGSFSAMGGSFSSGGIGDLGLYIKAILADQDSKQIFYFLLLNLSFMFVQMMYGVWTNSLGLISDSIHMFFDCLALGVGLFASVMSKWNANRTFSYGYNRIETLSGFSNGIFLCLISIFIVIEAIERLLHPPEMNTHRLLLVSFMGFVGVFLHIMADTLGSVGVIISTLLIDWFGWTGFDPIASMFIAVLIFLSVIPLIKDSASVLMLEVPDANLGSIEHALQELTNIPGVVSYSSARFWPNSPESLIGSIHIQVSTFSSTDGHDHHHPHPSSPDTKMIQQSVEQLLLSTIEGLSEVTVQVDDVARLNNTSKKDNFSGMAWSS
ncbi:putative zinc transporter msc2 [Mortierella sp. NVP85]|nr:putative zinc transporter msc2 [Mortierella sp. NVP85]